MYLDIIHVITNNPAIAKINWFTNIYGNNWGIFIIYYLYIARNIILYYIILFA